MAFSNMVTKSTWSEIYVINVENIDFKIIIQYLIFSKQLYLGTIWNEILKNFQPFTDSFSTILLRHKHSILKFDLIFAYVLSNWSFVYYDYLRCNTLWILWLNLSWLLLNLLCCCVSGTLFLECLLTLSL